MMRSIISFYMIVWVGFSASSSHGVIGTNSDSLNLIHETHPREANTFDIIALGTEGGPFWNTATSFLLQCPYLAADDPNRHNFIALDAGYLLDGIKDLGELGFLARYMGTEAETAAGSKGLPDWSWFWQNRLKGGLLTHSHLDHTGGMVIATQVNFGFSKRWFMNLETLQNQIDHMFNEAIWPTIAGPGPNIIASGASTPDGTVNAKDIPPFPNKFGHQLSYNAFLVDFLNLLHHEEDVVTIDINGKKIDLANHNGKTIMDSCRYTVREFPVNHGSIARSSAFLISYPDGDRGNMMMFFGDTAPDHLQPAPGGGSTTTTHLQDIWHEIALFKKAGRLSTIFIEVAMDDSTPDGLLFGHFKPSLFMAELKKMHNIFLGRGCDTGISGMNFVIIHIKGSAKVREGVEIRTLVQQQLLKQYKAAVKAGELPDGVTLHFPLKFEHIRIYANGNLQVLANGVPNDRIQYPSKKEKEKVGASLIINENCDFYYGFLAGAFFIVGVLILRSACIFRFRKELLEPFGPDYEL